MSELVDKLNEMKSEDNTPLIVDTANLILEEINDLVSDTQDLDVSAEKFVSDILEHGMDTGQFGRLTIYEDTINFYESHKEDMHEYLGDFISETGETPKYIIDALETYDGFANNMTWFVVAQIMYTELGSFVGY